jgi:DNA primase
VATCGTALTEDHLRLLRRFAGTVVLAFDADAAGQHAAERFYAWEKALDLEVRVAALPAGRDPGDLAMSDPAALVHAVDEAVPFLRFRLDRAMAAADLATAEGRARAAASVVAVIREHPNELVRDQYVVEVSAPLRIEPERLRAELRRPGARRVAVDAPAPSVRPHRETAETLALSLLIHRPDEIDPLLMVDPQATEDLFADGLTLAAFRALAATPTVQEAMAVTDPGAAELLLRLTVEEPPEGVSALNVVGLLAAARAQAELAAGASADDIALVKLAMEQLRDGREQPAAVDQLLAWLASRGEARYEQ